MVALGSRQILTRAAGLALALCAGAGCVATRPFTQAAAAPVPCQVVATWAPRVEMVPDTTRGGTPAPGIVGRVYLFGERIGHPIAGDGSVVVDLFDDTPPPNAPPGVAGASVQLERWHFDRDALARLHKKDTIGPGYTLFLPWGTYRPDVQRVRLAVRYVPTDGKSPLYAQSSPLTLDHSGASRAVAAAPRTPPVVVPPPQVVAPPPVVAPQTAPPLIVPPQEAPAVAPVAFTAPAAAPVTAPSGGHSLAGRVSVVPRAR